MTRPVTRRVTQRSAFLPALALALVLPLAACGGDDEPKGSGATPTEVLELAKKKFDETESVHLRLATESRPPDGNGVLSADGVLTHAPAFEGEVEVVLSGLQAKVPVVAIDGKLYAKLPLTTTYAPLDPEEYGAPDPADFVDPEVGISTLLTELQDVEETGQKRDGDVILTTYAGTLAGSRVAPIIPSADEDGEYATVVGIDADGFVVTLEVTGAFFTGDDDVTYRVKLDDYGKSVTIKKP